VTEAKTGARVDVCYSAVMWAALVDPFLISHANVTQRIHRDTDGLLEHTGRTFDGGDWRSVAVTAGSIDKHFSAGVRCNVFVRHINLPTCIQSNTPLKTTPRHGVNNADLFSARFRELHHHISES
jgi:hypothetical protein